MCGIVSAVANNNIVPVLLEGLLRLEYRGYDSAGLVITNNGLQRLRTAGRVAELKKKAQEQHTYGLAGIAHTRWATHGEPSERNAHPHLSGQESKIAVVHNLVGVVGATFNAIDQALRSTVLSALRALLLAIPMAVIGGLVAGLAGLFAGIAGSGLITAVIANGWAEALYAGRREDGKDDENDESAPGAVS